MRVSIRDKLVKQSGTSLTQCRKSSSGSAVTSLTRTDVVNAELDDLLKKPELKGDM